MIDAPTIAASARPLFAQRDELARRLATIDGMIDGLRRSYSREKRMCVMRPEAFRKEVTNG